MKTIILTYKLKVLNNIPDDVAIQSATEQCKQDSNWPSDKDITIEQKCPFCKIIHDGDCATI